MATISWDAGGDGTSWDDSSNWQPDEVPDNDDHAIVDLQGEYEIQLPADVTLQQLTFGAADGAQTLIVGNHNVTITEAAAINPGGVVHLNKGSISGSATVNNQGLILARGASSIENLMNASGGQVIVQSIQSFSTGTSSTLTIANGFTNQGLIELQDIDGGNGQNFPTTRLVISAGMLINDPEGTIRITSQAPFADDRVLQGRVENLGLIDAQADLIIANAGSIFDSSQGQLLVAAGKAVQIDSGQSRLGADTELNGEGTIDLAGEHSLILPSDLVAPETGPRLTLSGQVTVSGPGALINRQAGLTIRNDTFQTELINEGFLRVHDQNTIEMLTTTAGSTLQLQGVQSFSAAANTRLTVTNGFTNHGLIELTGVDQGGQNEPLSRLTVTNGTLTNAVSGTIRTLPGTGFATTRTIDAAIDNRGQIDAQTETLIVNAGHTFVSTEGVLNAAFEQTLTIADGTSILGAGTALSGEGVVDLSGTHALTLNSDLVLPGLDSQLAFGGQVTVSGPGKLINRQAGLTIRNDTFQTELINEGFLRVHDQNTIEMLTTTAGSTLQLQGVQSFSAAANTRLTVTNGFTNHGLIELTGVDQGGQNEPLSRLTVTNGTLTNAVNGTIRTLPGTGFATTRTIDAAIDNRGQIDAQTETLIVNAGHTFVSTEGVLNVAFEQTLTIADGTSILGAGTALSGEGVVDLSGTHALTLNSDLVLPGLDSQLAFGGQVTVSGPGALINRQAPLVIRNETFQTELVNEGFLRVNHLNTIETLTTTVKSTLQLQGVQSFSAGANTRLTVTNGFTNHGLIELTGVDRGGQNEPLAKLTVSNGVLVNAVDGTIRTLPGTGFATTRTIEGRVENRGFFDVQTETTVQALQGEGFHNAPTGTIELAADLELKSLPSGSMQLRNEGTLQKTTGTTTTRLAGELLNEGLVKVESGQLRLAGTIENWQQGDAVAGNTLQGGDWVVSTFDSGAAFATLQINDIQAIHNLDRASIVVSGSGTRLQNTVGDLLGVRHIHPGGRLALLNGAALDQGVFVNEGELFVGSESLLTVRDYTQAADSRLIIGLGGTPDSGMFGRIEVTGNANVPAFQGRGNLDGTLELRFVNGFGPQVGHSWELMTFDLRVNDFAQVDVPLIGRMPSLEVIRGATNVVVNALVTATNLSVNGANIVLPTEAFAGDEFVIEYTVDNGSETVAEGSWIDSLYLSEDIQLDPSDRLLARVTHTGDVPAQQSYTETVTATLPGAREGNYHVILVVDSRGMVPDTDRANNRDFSVNVISTRIRRLELGATITRSIETGQDVYYRVDVPAGRDVRIIGDMDRTLQAEFYARFGDLPDRSNFDVVAADPEDVIHRLLLAGRSGPWYLLLHGRERARSDRLLDLTAEQLDFELSGFSPASGGNVGQVTATLTGSRFTSETAATLIGPDATEYPAMNPLFVSGNELLATFDLSGLTAGKYNLRIDDNGQSSTAAEQFEVFESDNPGRLVFDVTTPRAILPRTGGPATVSYRNVGDTDAPLLPVTLAELPSRTAFGNDPTRPVSQEVLDRLAASVESTTPAVVPPGGEGVITETKFSTTATAPPITELVFRARTPFTDLDQPIDWLAVKEQARPQLISVEAWDAIFPIFVSNVGDTLRDLQRALSQTASYLQLIDDDLRDLNALLGFLFQQAENGVPNLALSVATDAATPGQGLPLSFTRFYRQAISSRYSENIFGRGWSHNYDWRLYGEEQGVLHPGQIGLHTSRVIVLTPYRTRIFMRQEIPSSFSPGTVSTHWSEVGGSGRIETDGTLLEASGTKLRFHGPNGSLSRILDSNLNGITLSYTGDVLTHIEHTDGDHFTLEYQDGRISKLLDHALQETTYHYDASGEHLLQVEGPGGTLSYSYVTNDTPAREHALASSTFVDGTSEFFVYDSRGQLNQVTRSNGAMSLTLTYYQGEITLTDATEVSSRLLFNSRGQIARVIDPLNQIATFSYDENDFLRRILLPENTPVDLLYDSGGLLSQVTDPLGDRIDLRVRGTEIEKVTIGDCLFAQCDEVELNTGRIKRLQRIDDQLDRQTLFEYDHEGNLLGIRYPDDELEVFDQFDAEGNPGVYINRRDQGIQLTWNDRGQLLRKDHADGSFESYTYDDRGNLITASDESGDTVFDYDPADRLIKVSYPTERFLQYDYNALGQLERLADNHGNETHYAYDELGRLERLTDASDALIARYDYADNGLLQQITRGNGTYTIYEVDDAGRLEHLIHHAPDDTVNSRFDYAYDALGRRTSLATLDGQWLFEYDSLGQLTRAEFETDNTDISDQLLIYDYDAAGNRIRTVHNGVVRPYSVNDRNQYVTVDGAVYSYDSDGNLISIQDDTGTSTYVWDDESRLIGVNAPDGRSWQYEYDALGNRTASVHNGSRTEYLVDPLGLSDVVAEYDASGNLIASYAYGLGLEARQGVDGEMAWYDFDGLGSTAGMTDNAGDYVNRYRYLPYGDPLVPHIENRQNDFEFAGQVGVRSDSNGLSYMRARYYEPPIGRFLNEDPIRHAGGVNLYSYVGNQPTTLIDPSGTQPFFISTWLLTVEEVAAAVGSSAWESATLRTTVNATVVEGIAGATESGAGALRAANPTPTMVNNLPTRAATESGRVVTRGAARGFVHRSLLMSRGNLALTVFTLSYMGGRLLDERYDLGTAPLTFWGDLACDLLDCENGISLAHAVTNVVASFDPNDIIGPAGVGDENHLTGDFPLPYMIRFENLDEATAPAQQVVVTQQLDPDLDWSTFEIRTFRFGDIEIDVPRGRRFYETRVDATATLGVLVDFAADINLETGLATWKLTALDPQSLDLPISPFVGFLPPNRMSPEGEGFVSYTIRPLSELSSGTRLDAQATIVFDLNDPIDTPAIFNTIDAGPPGSRVDPLAATTQVENFMVTWSGADDAGGSGIAEFDVFVSVDGGAFQVWKQATSGRSGLYPGQFGREYAFYSVATDQAGRREADPKVADTTTLVQISWQNSALKHDVNNSGSVEPIDALIVINYINASPGNNQPPAGKLPPPFYDVNGDALITSNDVLNIVNFINSGEVEAEAANLPDVPDGNSLVSFEALTAVRVDDVFRNDSTNDPQHMAHDRSGRQPAALPLPPAFPAISQDDFAIVRPRPSHRESSTLEEVLDELVADPGLLLGTGGGILPPRRMQ